jgi:hypothetical protein
MLGGSHPVSSLIGQLRCAGLKVLSVDGGAFSAWQAFYVSREENIDGLQLDFFRQVLLYSFYFV